MTRQKRPKNNGKHEPTVGDRVRGLRDKLKLNQTAFGMLYGVRQATVSSHENGARVLGKKSARALVRLARQHNYPLTLERLLGDAKDET